MLPSRSVIIGVLWAVGAIAAISRIPKAREIVFGA